MKSSELFKTCKDKLIKRTIKYAKYQLKWIEKRLLSIETLGANIVKLFVRKGEMFKTDVVESSFTILERFLKASS